MTERDPGPALQFPCEFPLKVFGRPGPEFESAVLEIVRRHGVDLAEGAVSARASRNGNYLALTVTFQARSRHQLDAIYQDLVRCRDVVMAL
ncbi:MAG: DUF493 domain-containing protein [Methylotetracoccus sp.]|jgi:hypothetical protein|nr:DUF493 domain-containing protein [Methylotetracoccus sp.]